MNIVIVNCFDTWEHRVELLLKVLMEEGHNVQVLMSDYCHIKKARRVDEKKYFVFFTAEPYKRNISLKRIHSHIQLGKDIFRWLDEHEKEVDVLWVLVPPNNFTKNAGNTKQMHPHIKVIFDIIDLWPETMPLGIMKWQPFFEAWKRLRDRSLKYADIVVTECNLYKYVLGNSLKGIKTQTLYLAREDNGYEPELNLPKDKIALCYLGSINNIIDISTIEEIIRHLHIQKQVVLHIIGEGEKRRELISVSQRAGAEVIYHGVIYDRKIKKKIFDSCHYGLNIMKDSVCVGLTMKSIDYFEFGLPIINNIKGDTWEIIEKYNCGVNWEKKTKIDFPNNLQRNKSRIFFQENLTENIFANRLRTILNLLIITE